MEMMADIIWQSHSGNWDLISAVDTSYAINTISAGKKCFPKFSCNENSLHIEQRSRYVLLAKKSLHNCLSCGQQNEILHD